MESPALKMYAQTMLTLQQIMDVGRMLEQTGGRDAQSPQGNAHSQLDTSKETIRVDLVNVLHPDGDVTIAKREQELPPGSRILEE